MTTNKICALFLDANAITPWQLYSVLISLKESEYSTKERKLYISSDQQFKLWERVATKLKLQIIRHPPEGGSLEALIALHVGISIQNKKLSTVAIASTKRAVDVIAIGAKNQVQTLQTLLISPNRTNTPFDVHWQLKHLMPRYQEKLCSKIVEAFVKTSKQNSEWVSAASLAQAIRFEGVNLPMHGYKNIGMYLKMNYALFDTQKIDGQLQCKLSIKQSLNNYQEKIKKLFDFFSHPDAHACKKSQLFLSLCNLKESITPQQELELLSLVKFLPEPRRVYNKRGIEFEVRAIARMVNYFKEIHTTRTMRKITAIFQKDTETRTDAENEFLCKEQLLCDLRFLHIYSDLKELIERITRMAPESRSERQIKVLAAFNKGEQRTDEDDKELLYYLICMNENIHADIEKSIERGW